MQPLPFLLSFMYPVLAFTGTFFSLIVSPALFLTPVSTTGFTRILERPFFLFV